MNKGQKQKHGRVHDGYKIDGSESGGYSFVEGIKPPSMLFSKGELKKIDQCAKRRGIKGELL